MAIRRHMTIEDTWAAVYAVGLLATTLVGVWAAYDRGAAWLRFATMAGSLGAAAAILLLARWLGEDATGWAAVGCGAICGALGIFFLAFHDWSAAGPAKLSALAQAGLWVQAHRPTAALAGITDGNMVGGALALLLPLGAGGLAWAWGRAPVAARAVLLLALALGVVALVLTLSRGAWFGLAAGCLAATWLAWGPGGKIGRGAAAVAVCLLMLAPALALAAFVYFPGNDGWLGSLGPLGVAAAGRAQLQRDMLPLARDYLFTGGGLASTGMLYSSYVLLTHVFYLPHAHNLYLQIVLEQGLPGLVALLGLLALAVGAALRAQPSPLRWAALAALVTLAVRGCVDADLYTTPTAAALCLPIGLALALPARAKAAGRPRRARTLGLAPAAGLAAIALVIWLQPSAQAAWQADLGAVAQSRAELGVYSWPAWPIQDAVRRSTAIDLNPAVGHYLAALADDPANFTANRRLGQIALSLGRYTAARTYLEAAYRVAPDDRATRQLLGESYAVAGDIAQAAGLWRTIDVSQGQLDARQFWYESIGDTLRAQRVRQAAAASG